ncbi:MAG TPA: hypothetical protein VFA50_09495 [Stellaceae bacterium]|nr:hypothetical protein [Stellaceae bacterium]
MPDDELRQADLSHLSVAEMSEAQKAELRRRYLDFVQRLRRPPAPKPRKSTAAAVKWVPAKKIR